MEAAGSNPPCGRCRAERAPYTCPRCHLRLCSVLCYREHGSCARDFQNRELQLRLQGQRAGEASRRRLEEALLRLRELREPGDEEGQLGLGPDAELEERLWERLSPEERKAFQRLLDSGEIAALLPPWEPWWEVGCPSPHGAALIQELDLPCAEERPLNQPGDPQSEQDVPQPSTHLETRKPLPAQVSNSVPAVIPPLASLTTAPVSPLVRFQLPNVLYGYAYALSLYNGDVEDEAGLLPEFCETVLDVSGALGAKQVYRSVAEALQSALQAVSAGRYPACPLGDGGALRAVARILSGESQAKRNGFSLAALGHLARLLSRGRRRVPAKDRARVFGAKKKCDFLLSWVNEHEDELTFLALEAQHECQAHLSALREVGAVTQALEKMWGSKVPPPKKTLIEELD
uniref:Zinc finger HIT domain-containing protein 2 n=1 Tax=Pogona vitticeps TaxID=103695 RepID=A0A6J0SH28_9SAUR